ncbi:hypothetical protein DCMF_12920 [Candidatus Formimonas warabiya]|uniref:Uncharacterized protein n=1 Tax=Formimonas warabiya TaxID=1761012 RepID=A0A3G1KSP9_FORW1|nr:hypothetical protein DCMF_12920 [Candidatus Formimonas warabiya]
MSQKFGDEHNLYYQKGKGEGFMGCCRRRAPVLAAETENCPVSPVREDCFEGIIDLIIILIVLEFLCCCVF